MPTALLVLFAGLAWPMAGASEPVLGGAFDETRFREDIRRLASDEFEGREPGSPGEAKTVAYIESGFAAAGLKPVKGNSFRQAVPLVSITASPDATLAVTGDDVNLRLAYGSDIVVGTKRVVETVSLEASEMVFAGYGIVAPEFGWNDYAGLDVRGKTVVVLVNDPGFASGDPKLFRGRTMTYYGRWSYKYEEAARQGAAGILIVHETAAAGYAWSVVASSWTGPQLDLDRGHHNAGRAAVQGWLSDAAAKRVFEAAGQDFDTLSARAAAPGFEPVTLGLDASLVLTNSISRLLSSNVIGYRLGTERPDETIILMAHWDHLGRDETLEGDQIYNGALDNATGTAALMELARSVASTPLDRSVVFAAVTAEESGLLGSAYYAEHPLFPLETTVAALNMDGLNVLGRTRDVVVIGWGQSELEDLLRQFAAAQDRVVVPEPFPEKGYFFRSDHFNLAKKGVPVLYAESGIDDRRRGAEWGRAKSSEYVRNHYHKPSDEYDPGWDLSGALEDMALYLRIVRKLALSREFPEWRAGSEFKPVRDASAAQRAVPVE